MPPELKGRGEVMVVPDLAAVAQRAAELFVERGKAAIHDRGHYFVALSGGNTPRPVFRLLAAQPLAEALDWSKVAVFWVDERCVPPDHPDSNYLLAWAELLAHVPVGKVHRMQGEAADPEVAARAYEAELRHTFGLGAKDLPRFDFLLLGMGDDGHVASLFPGSPALWESQRWVVAPHVPHLDAYRLSLTLPVLNNARFGLFLVSGKAKRAALSAALLGEPTDQIPASRVRPWDGGLAWVVDAAAAGDIASSA